MTTETRYVVVLGFAEHNTKTIGPFKTESDALLAKNTLKQTPIDYQDTSVTWGDGDTWIAVEERETITL